MKRKLTVNVNNMRRNTAAAYTELCDKLNGSIQDGGMYLIPDEIQEHMDDLRMGIASLMCIYLEGDNKFTDISNECDKIPHFNSEPQNEE